MSLLLGVGGPAIVLVSLLILKGFFLKKWDRTATFLLILQILIIGRQRMTGHSDHTVITVELYFIIAVVVMIVGLWYMGRSIIGLFRAIKGGSAKPVLPLGRTVLNMLGWLLQICAYLFVVFKTWALTGQAALQFFEGVGQLHSPQADVAAIGYGFATLLANIVLWPGLVALGLAAVLVVMRWCKRRFLRWRNNRAARKKQKQAAKAHNSHP